MIGTATYQPVTLEIAKELQAVVGEKNLIFGDAELLRNYSRDEVAGPEYARMPEVVVKPSTAREISEILKIANRHRVPVTPRGGGTGLSCGAVPLFGGIVLALHSPPPPSPRRSTGPSRPGKRCPVRRSHFAGSAVETSSLARKTG